MNHSEVIWQGITALVTILTVVATYLKARQERERFHAETSAKLDTPSGDNLGAVAERTHDMAALAVAAATRTNGPDVTKAAERLNADPKAPVNVDPASLTPNPPQE